MIAKTSALRAELSPRQRPGAGKAKARGDVPVPEFGWIVLPGTQGIQRGNSRNGMAANARLSGTGQCNLFVKIDCARLSI